MRGIGAVDKVVVMPICGGAGEQVDVPRQREDTRNFARGPGEVADRERLGAERWQARAAKPPSSAATRCSEDVVVGS